MRHQTEKPARLVAQACDGQRRAVGILRILHRQVTPGYIVLRAKDEHDIPDRAILLNTGDAFIDECLRIYSLDSQ
jgi:hypothetical protein